jgi:hypothetical protein
MSGGGHGPESVPSQRPVLRLDDGYDDDHAVQRVIKGIRRYCGEDADHQAAVEFVFFWATMTTLTSEQVRAVLARFVPPPRGAM